MDTNPEENLGKVEQNFDPLVTEEDHELADEFNDTEVTKVIREARDDADEQDSMKGTAALPSYSFTDDINTGIYRSQPHTIPNASSLRFLTASLFCSSMIVPRNCTVCS